MGGEPSIDLHGRPQTLMLPAAICRCLALVGLALLAAVALLVVARRLAGALETPLALPALAATGVLAAAVAAAVRVAWFLPPADRFAARFERLVMVLTSLAVAALAGGLSVPDTPVVGKFLLCTVVAAEESWAWAWRSRKRGPSQERGQSDFSPDRPSHQGGRNDFSPVEIETPASRGAKKGSDPFLAYENAPADGVTQQLTRSRADDGSEEISGWLRTAFAAGQRTGSVHVAFCPPLAATPRLEVEPIEGPEARIKTAQLLPYGARLDLKLAAAAKQPVVVLLRFSARTTLENP
jgi:hypothetical protein